jgi:mannose-6-phosphate isomerase-like protein (cupin superfamily)
MAGAFESQKALALGELAEPIVRKEPYGRYEAREMLRREDHAIRGKAESMPGTNVRYLCMAKKKTAGNATKSRAAAKRRAARPRSGRELVIHVPKPWGHETIWARTDRYVGKILHINAGYELSVQYHNRKDETIYLLSGDIVYRVQREGDDILDDVKLKIGESYRITPGTIHQIIARTDCDVLEVSTPELDDVVRLSDKYGREGTSEP